MRAKIKDGKTRYKGGWAIAYDKRCAEILKEVTEECQSRIDECRKGAYSKSLQ